MKLIKPSYEIIPQQEGMIGMFKHIETCGRVAWKSENRITKNSHVKFIEMLKGVNHGSVLEHGTVYLYYHQEFDVPDTMKQTWNVIVNKYIKNKYSKVNIIGFDKSEWECDVYITTNYRVLVDNGWLDDLKYQCEPTEHHEKRITVKFVCDRGVSHEFVRHRVFSFTQESTRYCNYSKDKFDNEITFIIPCWLDLNEDVYIENKFGFIENLDTNLDRDNFIFVHNLCGNERYYFNLIQHGWKPQQARSVLPNSLKTELLMTGFESDWKHFFELRTAKGAHPQAQELAIPLKEEFIKMKLI